MRRLIAIGALAVLTGCTTAEVRAWLEWWGSDPIAATEYANQPEIQADLFDDGIAQPEQSSVWDELAWCESGQEWSYNGGSGYDGGIQFAVSTWWAYGGRDFAEYAWQATREEQITVGERVLADVGWRAWPTCSRKLGLR